MSNEDHKRFVDAVINAKGKFLICGYDHKIYEKLVETGWNLYRYNSPNSNSDRIECLWYNYKDCKCDTGMLF